MQTRRVSLIGAALSANKGAAAMVETVFDRLPEVVGETHFSLLTTYPEQDAQKIMRDNVDVVGLEPWRLALFEIPVAVLAFLVRSCRLPLGWVRTRASRQILKSDIVVDVAGISFADGRGIPIVIYNTLMTGLPLLLGVPTVKAAQALGPFRTFPNNVLARLVLKRVRRVCARGAQTREHLDTIGLTNVVDVSDLAFSLDEAEMLPDAVSNTIAHVQSEFLVVMPSSVVKGIFEKSGEDYVAAMARLIRDIRVRTGKAVVLAPHSYRVGHGEGRMNDGPVCRLVKEALSDDDSVVLVDADLTAGELRHLVALCCVLVTSRFHAMISGLATATPTVVVGWSHKYKEVLEEFALVDYGFDSAQLSEPQILVDTICDALEKRDEISQQIKQHLPSVRKKSMRNFSVIAEEMSHHFRD